MLKRFTECPFDQCYICLLFSKTFFSMTKRPGTWLSTAIRRGHETITLHSTLHKWAKTRDQPVRVTDSCLGAMCNPTCPEMLKFVDTATDWGEVLNGVVLCMSLLFTVACVVLKFCFVSQLALLKRSRRHYLEEHIKYSQVKVFMSSTFLYMYLLLYLLEEIQNYLVSCRYFGEEKLSGDIVVHTSHFGRKDQSIRA